MVEVKNVVGWMKAHEESDKERFKTVHTDNEKIRTKIGSLYKYATSVAVVAGFVGFLVGWRF